MMRTTRELEIIRQQLADLRSWLRAEATTARESMSSLADELAGYLLSISSALRAISATLKVEESR